MKRTRFYYNSNFIEILSGGGWFFKLLFILSAMTLTSCAMIAVYMVLKVFEIIGTIPPGLLSK